MWLKNKVHKKVYNFLVADEGSNLLTVCDKGISKSMSKKINSTLQKELLIISMIGSDDYTLVLSASCSLQKGKRI